MRYILLSEDTQPILYEAPDAVAEALGRWAEAFLDEINRFDSHYWRPIKDGLLTVGRQVLIQPPAIMLTKAL